MTEKSAFQETYMRAAGAVAFVAIIDGKGDEGIGSAFHIGQGIFVTARHVIDGVTIKEIATTKSARLSEEAGGKVAPPRRLEIVDGPYFGPDGLDVAVFRVDLGDAPLPEIAVSQHTDASLGENDLVLSDILVIGYPPIPFKTIPSQVVTLGQINAVVRVRHSPVLHFIASAMARGGFSGGAALDQSGTALALVTESLGQGDMPVETGYMSLLSIEPAVDLAAENSGSVLTAPIQAATATRCSRRSSRTRPATHSVRSSTTQVCTCMMTIVTCLLKSIARTKRCLPRQSRPFMQSRR